MDENENEDAPRFSSLRKASPLPWILLAAAIVVGGIYLVYRFRAPSPAAPLPEQAAAPAAPAAAPEPTAEAAAAGEGKLSDLLPKVSAFPLVQKALAAPDFIRRAAVVIDNLAEGVSPRRELAFLEPRGAFKVVERGDRLAIDPASYARYDGFADAVDSVDVAALGAAFRAGRPALQAAYRMLGYPGSALDGALTRALKRLVNAPVRDGDVPVVDEGGLYTFADRRLERLPQVERHLLRMGPRNTGLLQAKARAIATELGLKLE